jgi:hypothetical protein
MTAVDGCALCALPVSEWMLACTGVDPAAEGIREALLTLGNGYLATRGAVPEADGTRYLAIYAAASTAGSSPRRTVGPGVTRAW